MHLQQTYIDLVSPAYHLWQTGVFLYEPRIDAYVSRTQICVLRGLGQRLNKQKPGISETVEMPDFSHLYIQMHCLLLYAYPKNCT